MLIDFIGYAILTAILSAVLWFGACAAGYHIGYRRALERWERAQLRRRQAAFGAADDGADGAMDGEA